MRQTANATATILQYKHLFEEVKAVMKTVRPLMETIYAYRHTGAERTPFIGFLINKISYFKLRFFGFWTAVSFSVIDNS